MKGLKLPFVISLIFHLLLVCFLYYIAADRKKSQQQLLITLLPPSPLPEKKGPAPLPLQRTGPQPQNPTPVQQVSESPTEKIETKPSSTPREELSNAEIDRIKKKQTFMVANPALSLKDSLFNNLTSYLSRQFEQAQKSAYPRDDIADDIQKRNQGTIPALLPTRPYKKTEKRNPPRFDFIPTEAQIQALIHLYKKGHATQIDLYASLDSGPPVTAEGFNALLDELVQKGFLTQKKISPENIFSMATPLGSIPIEMSRENRLNPVYEYKAQVNQAQLMTYLQARLYLLREEARVDSSKLIPKIQSLQQKIQILIR